MKKFKEPVFIQQYSKEGNLCKKEKWNKLYKFVTRFDYFLDCVGVRFQALFLDFQHLQLLKNFFLINA